MQNPLLYLGLSLGLILSNPTAALAVRPAPLSFDARVRWSTIVDDPYEGAIVYDKHFSDDFAFVTSWSKSGIRATYSRFDQELNGYTTVWRTRRYRDRHGRERREEYPIQEPVYKTVRTDRTPKAILLRINGTVYTYENGPVSSELAQALVRVPPGNLPIRFVWEDGGTMDTVIGKGTVEAWRVLFR